MELFSTACGKHVWFHQIERPFLLKPPFSGRRHVCIVFSCDETVTEAEREALTHLMFVSGCRFGVFTGHACGAWEWALDTACIASDPDYQPSEEAFTMTTSHEDETVEDVIFFGLMNTSYDAQDFDCFLILLVGRCAGLREEVESAIQSVMA